MSNKNKDLDMLTQIIKRLRAPDGCPWDHAQTHKTLGPFLLEETYEVLEEIDSENFDQLREELGDILLNIMLHSEIAQEENRFNISNVIEDLINKIIRRHPHVFESEDAGTISDVEKRWEVIKSREKDDSSIMMGLPIQMPSLLYAQRVQGRAASVGFDWESTEGVLEKLQEEIQELALAENTNDKEAEFGDIIFTIVNLGRHLEIDVETSLRGTNKRFVERFGVMEKLTIEDGKILSSLTNSEFNTYWEKSKALLANNI